MRGIDEEYLISKVEKGSITQEESDYIQSTEQVPVQ